jgi:hypothetical protein
MRKIYLFDADNGGLLGVGESTTPDRVSVRVSDGKNAVEISLGRESFRELCSLSYDIHWAIVPECNPCEPPAREEVEEEVPF